MLDEEEADCGAESSLGYRRPLPRCLTADRNVEFLELCTSMFSKNRHRALIT